MKFVCDRNRLTEAVTNVQRAVSSKSTIPALEGILIKASAGKISLFGYDLEICINTTIDASVQEEGSSVVKAKLFSDIIRKLPENNISIEVDEKNIVYIKCGKANFRLVGMPAEDYPEIPVIRSTDTIKIKGDVFSSMIKQTIYAVADTDVKPVNKGMLFEIENKTFRIVSLDGYRLAVRTEGIDYEGEKTIIVPGKSMSEVSKLIDDETEIVEITSAGRHVIFRINSYSVISRLIEGQFINYKASIPENHTTQLRINTRKFIDTIERLSLLLTDKMKSPIKCCIEDGIINATCNTPLGQAEDQIDVSMTGENIEIGFNNKFLLDSLRYSETDEIIMELSGATKAIVIKPTEGDSFLFMLMPMRLSR